MILFQSDAHKYPNSVIDYQTSNDTFLRLAKVYKEMDIKNWAFPLTLLQPEIQGLSPHSLNLTNDQVIKITLEIKYNPWYFLREVVRVPEIGSYKPSIFKANRANIFVIWAFLNHIDTILIQPRQTGKSCSVDSLMIWMLFASATALRIHLITKDAPLKSENIERMKMIRDYLPRFLYIDNRDDANNQIAITNYALNNVYKTYVGQKSAAGANKICRGMTGSIFHFDESTTTSNIKVTMPAALAAGTAARESARENGSFYGNIITTTAGDRDDRDGKFIYDLMDNGTPWVEDFLDSENIEDLGQRVSVNGLGSNGAPLLVGTFSHRQLGKTDSWLKVSIDNSRGDEDQINKDFLNRWTMGTMHSPISKEMNEKIYKSEIDPIHVEFSEYGYMLRWYVAEEHIPEIMYSNSFVLGMDTSEAIGEDAIGFVLIDISTLKTIGVAAINDSNLIQFGMWLVDFMVRYTTVTLVLEMKSSAQTILDLLLIELPSRGIDPFRRIYNKIYDMPEEYPEEKKEISKSLSTRDNDCYTKYRRLFGFHTTAEKRQLLYGNILQLAVKRVGHLVLDGQLSKEIRGLMVRNGRIDHKSSGHDDTCFAWLLCHWFLLHTRYHEEYGIEIGSVMSMVSDDGKTICRKDYKLKVELKKTKELLDIAIEKLNGASDNIVIAKLEQRIIHLNRKLGSTTGELYNLDAVFKSARDARRLKSVKRNFKKSIPTI